MAEDFTVTVKADTERGRLFEQVFGTRTVHVRSPFPHWARLPGRDVSLVYELDLALISAEQRERLVAHIATTFGIPAAEVETQLEGHGVPILAEDTVSVILDPWKWF